MAEQVGSERLAELTIALSLATDLGTGQPMEQGLRTCWLSLAASEALGLEAAVRSCVFYVALLRFLGCTSGASETAVLAGGDDVAFNATMAPMLAARSGESMRFFVRHLAEDLPAHRRAGRVVRALADSGTERRSLSSHCEVAARLGSRLGMGDAVCDALSHAYERWDGKGYPAGLAGDAVPLAIRVVSVARDAELWSRQAGWPQAVDVLARRRGHAYDPVIVDAFLADGERWLAGVGDDLCAAVLDAEPGPVVTVGAGDLDRALAAVADFADLKSPFLRGHSPGVASLATSALAPRACRRVTPSCWAGQRWCMTSDAFADLAARHHERVDGSGYHRGAAGDQLVLAARLLAAADAYHAVCEERPHRPPLSASDAASQLLDDVDTGRFTRPELDAVLTAAGQARRPASVARPAGLTEREVDVLRLIARGPFQQASGGHARDLTQDGGQPRRAPLRKGRGHHPGWCDALRHGTRPPITLTRSDGANTPCARGRAA